MRAIAILILSLVAACGVGLTTADYARIASDSATILNCQQVGRDCKAADAGQCYQKYDACMQDSGLRP